MAKRNSPAKTQVICASRRTDVVGNSEMLVDFLRALDAETITYDHPRFVRNTKTCTVSLAPDNVFAIRWLSKDYTNLLNLWENDEHWRAVLERYHHHFTVTINGPRAFHP